MSALEKAQASGDSGIKCHFKQYLETIMQSYSRNSKYLLQPWTHLCLLVADGMNLGFFFLCFLACALADWVANQLNLAFFSCFVSGPGICLCFIFSLPVNKKSKPACPWECWRWGNAGLCCKEAGACNAITQQDRVPSEGAWCAVT